MKKGVLAGFVLLLAGVVLLNGCSSKASVITNMNAHEFSAKAQESGVVVLDVRTPAEFSQGHIQGAMNIDVEAPTFNAEIAKLDITKSYAVYCHTGRRSGMATSEMAKFGFKHIFNLQNGFADWMARGMMVVVS